MTNPTKSEIIAALKRYKSKSDYRGDDQLFIFFAGHGTFVQDFREGYLIAKNSIKDDSDASTYLSHSQLRNIIDQIPCKHIFVVIDACFSGTFDERIRGDGDKEYDSAICFVIRTLGDLPLRLLPDAGQLGTSRPA